MISENVIKKSFRWLSKGIFKYTAIQTIFLLYYLIAPMRWIGRIWRMLSGDWIRPVWHLLALSLGLSLIFSVLTVICHVDPLELDDKVQNISSYSIFMPADEQQISKLMGFFTNESSFQSAFSEKIPFQSLLSNNTIYNFYLADLNVYPYLRDNTIGSTEQNLEIISNNSRLQQQVLAGIFENESMLAIAISITSNDPLLQEYLLEAEPPFLSRIDYLYPVAFIWYYWKGLLFLWVLQQILLWRQKVGTSLAVVDFADETKEGGEKAVIAPGLSSLLVARLNRLSGLYYQVDEARPVSSVAIMENKLESANKAGEGDLSTNIFTEDSKLELGTFAIPGKLINSLIDRFTGQPKIQGSLFKDGDREILTARISGGGRTLSWRVDGKEQLFSDQGQVKNRTRDDMVTELAYRIFTDLTFDRAKIVNWEATWHFTEGLRKYRELLNVRGGYLKKLEGAAEEFHQAISRDDDFHWAHYNLGIVYMELGGIQGLNPRQEAEYMVKAKRALCSSLERYPQHWQPYYALAMICCELSSDNKYTKVCNTNDETKQNCDYAVNESGTYKGCFKSIDWVKERNNYCDTAIKLGPDWPGLVWICRLRGEAETSLNKKKYYQLLSLYAICSLIKAEFLGENTEEERYLANKCLYKLANFNEIDKNNGVAAQNRANGSQTEKNNSASNNKVFWREDIKRLADEILIPSSEKFNQVFNNKKCGGMSDDLIKDVKDSIKILDLNSIQSKLKMAALLDNHPLGNWEIPWWKGRSYLKELQFATKESRTRLLADAHDQISNALSLCRDADVMEGGGGQENKIKCLTCLGWICLLQKNYSEAITHLLAAKEGSNKYTRITSFCLGLAYLKFRQYDEARVVFEKIQVNNTEVELCIPEMGLVFVQDHVPAKVTSDILCVYIKIYLTISYIERDVNFKKAQSHLEEADRCINSIDEGVDKDIVQSCLEHCWGWLHLRRSILEGTPEQVPKIEKISFEKLSIANATLDEVIITGGVITNASCEYRKKNIWLENANIYHARIQNLVVVGGISIKASQVESATIEKARVESMVFFCDKIEGRIAKTNNMKTGIMPKSKHTLDKTISFIEGARLSRAVLQDVVVKDAIIEGITIKHMYTVDQAVDHLNKSLALHADHYAYLHLAQAYDLQQQREKDESKKAHLKQMALIACGHSLDLDRFEEHTAETEALKKRLEGATSAGSPAPEGKEKEGPAKVEEAKGAAFAGKA